LKTQDVLNSNIRANSGALRWSSQLQLCSFKGKEPNMKFFTIFSLLFILTFIANSAEKYKTC